MPDWPIPRPAGARAVFSGGLFAFACFQATFLTPYMILAHGQRTNLFSPTLMAAAALVLLALPSVREGLCLPPEVWGWLGLGGLLAASALTSASPVPSLLRAYAFWAPAVAGLFCAWGLLRTLAARRLFFVFLTVLFAGLSLLHLLRGPQALGLHSHALAGMLLLLSAGPIFLFFSLGRKGRAGILLLLCLGYAACFLAGSRFLVLLPLVLVPILVWQRRLSKKAALAILGVSAVLCLVYFALYPRERLQLHNNDSVSYRLENYPAAWEIVRQHPLLGIGIRAARTQYLQDFQVVWDTDKPQRFFRVVRRNVSSENQFLSLLVDVGVPATLLYLALLAVLVRRYVRNARQGTLDQAGETGLCIVLLATALHFFIYDGLYYPQINWFFHLMLGMAAGAKHEAAASDKEHVVNPEQPEPL